MRKKMNYDISFKTFVYFHIYFCTVLITNKNIIYLFIYLENKISQRLKIQIINKYYVD